MKAKNEQNSILYSSLEFGLTVTMYRWFFGTGNLVNDVTLVRPILYYSLCLWLWYAYGTALSVRQTRLDRGKLPNGGI